MRKQAMNKRLVKPLACPDTEAIPEVVPASRPLAEAHRLDLALFVAFGEASLRVSTALARHAPDAACLSFAEQQALDDSRFHQRFLKRLEQTLASTRPDRGIATEIALLQVLLGKGPSPEASRAADSFAAAVVLPPLRRFLVRCQAAADAPGSFLEAVALLDLTLKGMACPLYVFEACYWRPVDPYLAGMIDDAAEAERRNIVSAAHLMRNLLASSLDHRQTFTGLCAEGRSALEDVFGYYADRLVRLFAVARRQQPDLFAGVEIAPGRPLLDTDAEEQIAIIQDTGTAEHLKFLKQAGLDTHG
jgi:hypothetical protein